jgi:drug/metabolite transporter (DMT)-like permease
VGLCLLSATAFGFAAVLAKEGFGTGLDVSTLLVWRFGLAAAVFWLIVARRRPAPLSLRAVLTCVGLGGIGYALQAGLYFAALTHMDAAVVGEVLYTYPALVLIISVALRRESLQLRKIAALACSGIGLLLLVGGDATPGSITGVGLLLAVGCAVTYALYICVASGLPADSDVYLVSAIVTTSATVSLVGYGVATKSLHTPSAGGWLWISLLALVATVFGVSFFLAGLRLIGGSTAAIVSCLEPVVTAASAMVVFGERLSAVQLVGAAAVLSAVVVLQRK